MLNKIKDVAIIALSLVIVLFVGLTLKDRSFGISKQITELQQANQQINQYVMNFKGDLEKLNDPDVEKIIERYFKK